MRQPQTIRGLLGVGAIVCLLGSCLASAQVSSYGDKETGQNTGDQLPKVLKGVQVSQHLNQQLPLDSTIPARR